MSKITDKVVAPRRNRPLTQDEQATVEASDYFELVANVLGKIHIGTGTPEGEVGAPVSDLFLRLDGGASTSFYIKTSGTGNTGWTAIGGGGGNVSNSGTPTVGQIALWVTANTIEGVNTITASLISDFDAEVSNNTSVAANTSKVTNATHTGDVAGATVLTIGAKKVTLAMMEDGTDGELITYDSSGVAAKVAVGTDAQVLTSNGAGAAPTFQTPAQQSIVLDMKSSQSVNGNASMVAMNFDSSIKDSNQSSSLLIIKESPFSVSRKGWLVFS